MPTVDTIRSVTVEINGTVYTLNTSDGTTYTAQGVASADSSHIQPDITRQRSPPPMERRPRRS